MKLEDVISYDPSTGEFRWLVRRGAVLPGALAGTVWRGGPGLPYRRIKIDGKMYQAGRLAWRLMTGQWPEAEIDHENTDSVDDRWENLREATPAQNKRNRRLFRNNTSGVKGVYAMDGKFRAFIWSGNKERHLGMFEKFEEAVAAVGAARKTHHGDFARAA